MTVHAVIRTPMFAGKRATTKAESARTAASLNVGPRERYRQYPTIAEAALIWTGLSFELLDGCEYLRPGVPDIAGRPEVAARAEALLEATDEGDLACRRAYRPGRVFGEPPEFPEEIVEMRRIARKDLVSWLAATYPGEVPEAHNTVAAKPGAANSPSFAEGRLLPLGEVLDTLGIGKTTLYRWMSTGEFPPPTHANPNRWPESAVRAYMGRAEQGAYRP